MEQLLLEEWRTPVESSWERHRCDGRKTPWRARGIASLRDRANKMSLCILPEKPFPSSYHPYNSPSSSSSSSPLFSFLSFVVVVVFVVAIPASRIEFYLTRFLARGKTTRLHKSPCNQSFRADDRINDTAVYVRRRGFTTDLSSPALFTVVTSPPFRLLPSPRFYAGNVCLWTRDK